MHPDLLALAARQGGALTRSQLLRYHDTGVCRLWLEAGLLVRIAPGVFALDPAPSDTASLARRVELALGVPLIVCGPTAGRLHGFPEGLVHSSLLHVTTSDGRSMRHPRGVRVHQWIPRSEPVMVGGITVVPFDDTAIDVATAARSVDRLAILDAVAALDPSLDLTAALDRAAGRRGIEQVRRLAAHASPLSESPMESRARQRILDAGLPEPEVQVKVVLPSGVRRLDLGYRARRIGLEYDGEAFHTGDDALRRDRRRHLELTAAGWTILYLTADDVYVHPDRFLRTLRGMLVPAA